MGGSGAAVNAAAGNTAKQMTSSQLHGSHHDHLALDDDGNVFEALPEPSVPRDLKQWLRPPALIRVPLQGRLVQMQRYGQRKY